MKNSNVNINLYKTFLEVYELKIYLKQQKKCTYPNLQFHKILKA